MVMSRDRLRLYTYLALLFGALAVVAVLGGLARTSFRGVPLPSDTGGDRIAYVDLDRQVWTMNAEGSEGTRMSPEGPFFAWPTWSPDGQELVFSGVLAGKDEQLQAVLYVRNGLGGELRELHIGEPGVGLTIGRDVPHYATWSPDSRYLAFVGGSSEGLKLYVDDLRDSVGPKATVNRAPLFHDWSPDSRHMLVHGGQEHFVVDAQVGVTTDLGLLSDGYAAPTWKPFSERITFVAGDAAGGYALYTADIDGEDWGLVGIVPRDTAFLWSPNGRCIAVTRPPRVLQYRPLGLLVYQRVSLYEEDSTLHPAEIQEDVAAFFWSTDSTKLAYVTLTETPGVLRWNILNVADETRWPLVDFVPTVDQLTAFRFFDSYAHLPLEVGRK